jgi:hypothetical protein
MEQCLKCNEQQATPAVVDGIFKCRYCGHPWGVKPVNVQTFRAAVVGTPAEQPKPETDSS